MAFSDKGRQRIVRQILLYAIIGVVQICTDWACFVALTELGMDVIPANLCGRVVGASLGFWLNGQLTFARTADTKLGVAQAIKYLISWIAMTCLSTAAVWAVEQVAGIEGARMAKPVIDIVLAGLGFIVSKLWIYR
ncbi:GtrA family protein [Pseudoxanthomonas sp. SL93]|jgi:putative flippase GtrA|uniref:GtrA family protein n=1 Tax=Pseudoxanthomonas sp. SL93 TaxID=2995142 RepID=UPI00226D6F65|nr:GtrA family protein [Pseudoxanthomonas sp. SL93]WAC63036.1 GtrA family protein [Pseudoxanthomonas sp. SL93]